MSEHDVSHLLRPPWQKLNLPDPCSLQWVPRAFPLLKATGVALHAFVPVIPQNSVGSPGSDASGAGVVDDNVLLGLERLKPFFERVDAQGAGDVLCLVFPLTQDHDKLEVLGAPIQLLLQLFHTYEVHYWLSSWLVACSLGW